MTQTSQNGLSEIIRLFSKGPLDVNDWPDSANFEPDRLCEVVDAKIRTETEGLALHKLYVIQLVLKLLRREGVSMSPAMLLSLINESTGISIPELRELLRPRSEKVCARPVQAPIK